MSIASSAVPAESDPEAAILGDRDSHHPDEDLVLDHQND